MPELPASLRFPNLRKKISAGEVTLGLFSSLASGEVVEMAGLSGWDFLIADGEHGLPNAPLAALVRAGVSADFPVIVRVASNDHALIQHALDSGAAGIQIPQIASVEAAKAAVHASRFHPVGKRGLSPYVRASSWGVQSVPEYFRRTQEEVALILQVESTAGIEAVDSILELEGIDVLFVGPNDLSQSLGVPGETSHPKVANAVQGIVGKAEARGVRVGIFSRSDEEARMWLELGVKYLCYSVDTLILLEGLRVTASRVRKLFNR